MRAEVLAARLEALARAESAAGNLWRSELAMAEAVASAGLEGLRISEGDLLPRVSMNGGQEGDPVEAEFALGLLRALKSPGDPLSDPVGCVRRFEEIAGTGMEPDLSGEEHAAGHRLGDEELDEIFGGLQDGDMPIVSALRVAGQFAARSERANPVVERLIFMAVEGALRDRTAQHMGAKSDDLLRGLSGRVDASWVAPPSLALSSGRFLPWSPSSEQGLLDLAEGLNAILSQEIGRFGLARGWFEKCRAESRARHGKSKMSDAIEVMANAPLVTSSALAQFAGMSTKGAISTLTQMTDAGLLTEVTRRRSARIWAVPSMASRLMSRSGLKPSTRDRLAIREELASRETRRMSPEERQAAEVRMEKAFGDLEAALKKADTLMGGVSTPIARKRKTSRG